MNTEYNFDELKGLKIKVYPLKENDSTVNILDLYNCCWQFYSNIKKFYPDIFKDVLLEIWNCEREDAPKNITECKDDKCVIKEYGVSNYAGLTWGEKGYIQINSKYTDTPFNIAQVICHEFGHLLDYRTEQNDPNDLIFQEWKRIRGKDFTKSTPPAELMAEDIRLLFGDSYAKSHYRGDYKQADQVQGLKHMLLVWGKTSELIKAKKPRKVDFEYSAINREYFGVRLYCNDGIFVSCFNGLYKLETRFFGLFQKWVLIKTW